MYIECVVLHQHHHDEDVMMMKQANIFLMKLNEGKNCIRYDENNIVMRDYIA